MDVAVMQSLHRKDEVKDFVAEYGQVIVDECHHISAFTFEQVMKQVKAKYVVGLTATPTRKDGHHPIIYMQCGPIRFSMSARTMTEATPFRAQGHPASYRFPDAGRDGGCGDSGCLRGLGQRFGAQRDDRWPISDGPWRLDVRRSCSPAERSISSSSPRKWKDSPSTFSCSRAEWARRSVERSAEALAAVPENEARVIIATGSYIGEGFDDARLDTLFLAMPISWKGTLQQYVGRLHRLHDGKRVVQVYDYVDPNVPMLARMYERRLRGYDAIGYTVERPQADLLNTNTAQI